MKDKRVWLVVLCVAIVVLIISWPAGKDGKTIRMVDGLSVNSQHVFLADKLGYFNDAGLNVEVSYVALGKFAMDALNGGGAEYAGVVEMNIAQTVFTHDDIAILCEYAEPITGIKLLARRDHGIEAASDLVGKKIAVFFGVNIHIFAMKFLEANEIALGDVVR